jgi:hypothetical protein
MIAYNGGSISRLATALKVGSDGIWVTDTVARATRYANAQATGVVDPSLTQGLAEDAVILEIECEPMFSRRPEGHPSLDHAEDRLRVGTYRIVAATIRFSDYEKRRPGVTTYGSRGAYTKADELVAILQAQGVEVRFV